MDSTEFMRYALEFYGKRADALEQDRLEVTRNLSKYVEQMVIPSVEKQLPKNYGVTRDQTEIFSAQGSGEVPIGFRVSIMLSYNNLPIRSPSPEEDRIGEIQRSLKPTLENIASTLGLSSIQVFGEPIHMD
jgi:hypothetical protein